MAEQAFLKKVRETAEKAQAQASQRWGSWVERGREALPGAREQVERLQRRAHTHAVQVAEELRRLADRIERFGDEDQGYEAQAVPVTETVVESNVPTADGQGASA